MNKGLIIKEIYALRSQVKAMLLMIGIFTAVAVYSGNDGMMLYVNTLLLTLGVMINLNAMAEDEKYNWDMYGLTLPVKRTEVIAIRYFMLLVFMAVAGLYMLALHGIVYLVHGLSVADGMISAVVLLVLIVLLQCILLPVAVKAGSARARLCMIAILGIPFVIIAVFMQMVDESVWRGWLPSEQVLIQLAGITKFAVPVFLLVILTISYRISVSVFTKKEF